MSDHFTYWALALLAVSLLMLDLLGWWSIAEWWNAMAEWAPIGVLVTVGMVLGWQAVLTHPLLGAVELVRVGPKGSGVPLVTWLNVGIHAVLHFVWLGSCVIWPGLV